jgi:Xaa-Pro aminopeptidase
MGFNYAQRVRRLQDIMRDRETEVVLLSVGSDLPYFTGYEAMATERLTMLVIREEGEPVLFVPNLEAPRVESGEFSVVGWGELEDPIAMVAALCSGAERVAVGDHTWSTFLVELQRRLPGMAWLPSSHLTKDLRMMKDPAEIECLRSAAHAVDRVLARIPGEVRFSGRTEMEVASDLRRMTVEEGHDEASFAIVASGPNGASPHHEPGRRVISEGELVICDFGGRRDGYCSDVTRTFSVGAPSAQQVEVHAVVAASNKAGRDSVAPGIRAEEVDNAARSVIEEAGYGKFFIHRTGHGIGLEVHEHPYVVEGNATVLKPGMSFSVEPGIYLPDQLGVRIEDIVACDADGLDDLNLASRDLVVVG